MSGWVPIPRSILDQQFFKDADTVHLYLYLQLKAAYKPTMDTFDGQPIELQKGQLITGRKQIANDLNMSESKVERVLKRLQNGRKVNTRNGLRMRLISIIYEVDENESERETDARRTRNEREANTFINKKNNKENNNDYVNTGGAVEKKYYWDLFRQVQADEVQMVLCMKNYGISKEQVTEQLKKFFRLKLSEQHKWNSFADAKRNFYYWLGTQGDRIKEAAPEPEMDKDAIRALQDDFYNSRLGPADKPKTA